MEKVTMRDRKEDILKRYEEIVRDYDTLVGVNTDLTENLKKRDNEIYESQHQTSCHLSQIDTYRNKVKDLNELIRDYDKKLSISFVFNIILFIVLFTLIFTL